MLHYKHYFCLETDAPNSLLARTPDGKIQAVSLDQVRLASASVSVSADPTIALPRMATVFVGNLSWSTTNEGLQQFMSSSGIACVSREVQSHADTMRSTDKSGVGFPRCEHALWSPSGNHIAHMESGRIVFSDPQYRNLKVTSSINQPFCGFWSPDSRKFCFLGGHQHGLGLFLVDLESPTNQSTDPSATFSCGQGSALLKPRIVLEGAPLYFSWVSVLIPFVFI
jgi:hypothetical protein